MSYTDKYLKYKNKYLELKNQVGGNIADLNLPKTPAYSFLEAIALFLKNYIEGETYFKILKNLGITSTVLPSNANTQIDTYAQQIIKHYNIRISIMIEGTGKVSQIYKDPPLIQFSVLLKKSCNNLYTLMV
jgi:hypothetical protein